MITKKEYPRGGGEPKNKSVQKIKNKNIFMKKSSTDYKFCKHKFHTSQDKTNKSY
jgi:hypothetical protein